MTDNRLIYLPLGGAGEVGMNCYVYGYGAPGKERLVVVDLGVTFGSMETAPGIDLIWADAAWLAERSDRIEAVCITHAHEDHVGALGHLYGVCGKAPVYCRTFTALHARRKLEEQGHDDRAVHVVDAMAPFDAGPFRLRYMPVAHSIPEASALVIEVGGKRILHTGDFKTDQTPVLGDPHDPEMWRSVAGDDLDVLVCDSTNVNVERPGRSEAVVGPELRQLVEDADGMVVATTFASNVARVKQLAEAGRDAGRTICLLGRAMQRMVRAAVESGVMTDFPHTVDVEDARNIARGDLMLIVTGSQGERRAGSAQLARGEYLGLKMQEGDTFLFSSKTIPGNEEGVLSIANALSEKGVRVIDDSDGRYHVSGHANRPDIAAVHELTRPRMIVPMHGDHLMLSSHARLAQGSGVPTVIAVNGTMVDLTGDVPQAVEYVETGRVYLDGDARIGALDGVVRDRIRMALNGLAVVSLIIDEDGEPLGEPWVELMGLPQDGRSGNLAEALEAKLESWARKAGKRDLDDDDALEDALRRVTRNAARDEIGKKPEVVVVISRLSD